MAEENSELAPNDGNDEEIEEIIESPVATGEIEILQKELEEIRAKSEEYLDGWQRARAEFANYKKRIEREREQVHQAAAGSILRRFLDVVDDMERALKNRPTGEECESWTNGLELIYRKMHSILESEGVQRMEAKGEYFDPNLHEAISHEENPDYESGQIIEVVQSGYTLGDRVLRPAMVRVAR